MHPMTTEALLNLVNENINIDNGVALGNILSNKHPADVAEVIQLLPNSKRYALIELLDKQFDPNILSYLEDSIRDEIVESFVQTKLSSALSRMDESDALHILEDLEPEERRALLRTLKPDLRAILEDGLSYQDDSAGRLMSYEFIALPFSWTASQALLFLKTAMDFPEDADEIFVVNDKRRPIGKINLSILIKSGSSQILQNICQPFVKVVDVNMPVNDICRAFEKYLISSIPVVSMQEKLVGVIKVHNIIDVIVSNIEDSFLNSAGIKDSDFYDSLWPTLFARIKWIMIAGLQSLAVATVNYKFKHVIEANVILSSISQIVMTLSSTAGLQVATVTVRALLERHLMLANVKRAILKEIIMGAINGLICGSLLSIVLYVASSYIHIDIRLCFVMFTAVFSSMVLISGLGFILPIILNKLGVDPSISSGPLISSLSDAFSMLMLLSMTSWLLSAIL